MTSAEFVRRLRIAVYDSAVDNCLELLRAPAGRRPSESTLSLAQWFNPLSSRDQDRVREVVQLAARTAVFGMLALLDGVTAIREDDESVGDFELRYNVEGESVLLNGPGIDMLHDLFAAEVPPA